MKKISKIILLSLTLLMLIPSVVSCKDGTEDGKNTTDVIDEDVIYSSYVSTSIILGEGLDTDDISAVRQAYYKLIGREIAVEASSASKATHEIIIGKTDRELSEKAYRVLSRIGADTDVGYVIYSDGRSVALAFDEASFGEDVAYNEAIEYFIKKYMSTSSLKLESGIVYYETFDPIERQSERDEERIETRWELKLAQISAKLGSDEETAASILKELKSLRLLYNNDYAIVKWLANLYDPESGGFYYSNSARNNEGYLPDLESTSYALGLVEAILTGYGGTLTDYFGEEIAEKFVSFAKNMQDQNGYFYHPQWSHELTDKNPDRKERDVLNALNILDCFGASPIYDTPNGVKGEGTASPVSSLITPLRESTVSAVSQLVNTNDSEIYIPAYLKSKSAFESYLSSLDIRANTTSVCETLYSEISLYKAIDEMLAEQEENYRLCSILENHITAYQNYYTGLWCTKNNITYEEIGELSSVIKLYDALGTTVPRISTIIEIITGAMSFAEEVDDISDIYNIWSALASLVNNITSYGRESDQSEIDGCLKYIYSGFDTMLSSTREKLCLFLREDGSFSTTTTGSASEAHGMSVAVPAMEEGDMSATLLAAKNIWLSVFGVLDIGSVPVFHSSDRMTFQKTLLDMGIIIKNEVKKTDPLDFEGAVGGDTGITHTQGSSDSYAEIVEGPKEHGNVLKLYSSSEGLDQYFFSVMTDVKSASCFTYELDMCVLSESSTASFANLYIFQDTYMIALYRSGNTIRFYEESSRSSSKSRSHDLGIRAEVGEWFNLRVEYYLGTAETVRIKIFFNGECIAVTDNYFGSHNETGAPNQYYNSFAIYGIASKTMDVLVDNVITEKSYQTYTVETSSTLNKNIDTPDKSQTIYGFESLLTGSTPLEFEISGDRSSAVVTTDSDNNKLLSISNGVGEIILPLDQRGSGINSALIEFDFTLSANSIADAKYQINFNEYLHNERSFGAMQIMVVEENGSKYATLAEVVSGNTGTVYTNVKLSTEVKYHLSFRIFFEEGAVVTSVDSEIVGVNTNVLDECTRFYMGETSIESKTPSIVSTILIDNLVSERVRADFAEVTSPAKDSNIYTFDNTTGMELLGVNPSEGTLSFENAGSGESYVKIPVNTRVNVPTLSLFGLDIMKAENYSGSITIYLTDISDNIIAAFDMVYTNSGVDIYEHTKNGRYKTPIHTVENNAFTLSAEYSAEKESLNLLVDGEYVAATSLIYTEGSTAYDFKYLRISSSGKAGFIIDNIYAEEISGVFKAHSVSMPNTDSTDKIMTYESSSFASMPSNIEISLGASTSYLRIKEGFIDSAVTKVLEFNSGKGASNDNVIFTKTQSAGGNGAYFETNMMLKSDGSKIKVPLAFRGETIAYSFTIEAASPGSPVKISGDTSNKDLGINEGEWFNIRLEYTDTPYDFDYDGNIDILFKAYINGVLVETGYTPYNAEKVQSGAIVNQLRISVSSGITGKIYFDNTTLGNFDMTYQAPVAADTDTITYEPGVITNKTTPTLGTSSSASIIDMTVEGAVTKVLNIYSASSSTDKLAISPTVTLDGANAITFETDIMIAPETDTATLYLEPMTFGSKQPFRLIIKAVKGGDVTISSTDIPETVIGKSGEWIHLKVDYMNPRVDYDLDGTLDILYKIYINGEEEAVAVGYKPYSTSAYYKPAVLNTYLLTVISDSVANIYLDNTRFWQTELTPDEAPKPESTDSSPLGGTENEKVDNNGWV